MEHLRKTCTVVFLDTDVETLLSHIKNLKERGIVLRPGQSFEDLYRERRPLYERYADVTVRAGRPTPNAVAADIIKKLDLPRK